MNSATTSGQPSTTTPASLHTWSSAASEAPSSRDSRGARPRPIHAILRYGYVPLMLVGFGGVVITLSHAGISKVWLVATLLGAVAVSFAAERILPYRRSWNRPRGDGRRDVAHAVVNEASHLAGLWVMPPLVSLLAIDGMWPDRWPFAAQVLMALLVADIGLTLGHYASHRVGWLWRFHAVHHSVERMYGFNGLLKHPVHQLFETILATSPLILLGLPTDVAVALVGMVTIMLLIQHSNVDFSTGPFRWVLATSEVHRFHHLRWPGVGDVNFGLFTTVWDHLLGTYSFDPSRRFDSSVLGIAKEPDYPVGYLRQLAQPFRR